MSENTTPPVEDESEEIVVTGTRLHQHSSSGGGGGDHYYAVYVPPTVPDLFAQYGGDSFAEIANFNFVDGKIVVRLPGYSFPIIVPATDWAAMPARERADFIKLMNEFRESPMLVATLDNLQAEGARNVYVRFDDKIHRADGTVIPYPTGRAGQVSVHYAQDPVTGNVDTNNIVRGTDVIININSKLVPGSDGVYETETLSDGSTVTVDFSFVFLHEIRHTFYPGSSAAEESQSNLDARTMRDNIFNTPGAVERSGLDYIGTQTFVGSVHGDNLSGGSAGDTMAGLSGDDTLDGGAGDDLVMGGAGMDRLSGGVGSNYVLGGLDADTYVPAAGVTVEVVSEMGGVDRIDLGRISINDIQVARYGDSMTITYTTAGGSETIQVENHWLEGGKVEQFTFAEGTFAASYIEELAGSGPGGVCYDGPNPVICGPYGLPVVLDLDGDGLELIDMRNSKARFDIDGDGTRERIGWVGAEDGLLALDRNGNGRIDDFSEISFLQDFLGAGSDLEGLFAYDSDGDGYLTAGDARFSDFLVWRDMNGNGHSERKELFTLDELGIVSISLERKNIVGLDVGADRNQVLATSSFQTADGRTFQVGDVALYSDIGDCGCHSSTTAQLGRADQEWVL